MYMKYRYFKSYFGCVFIKNILKNFNDFEKDICFLFRGNKYYNESIWKVFIFMVLIICKLIDISGYYFVYWILIVNKLLYWFFNFFL